MDQSNCKLEEYVGRDFAEELVDGSSIDPEVALERPYVLVKTEDLPRLGYSESEVRRFTFDEALLIPNRSPDGKTIIHQTKPLRKTYSKTKYLYPHGSRMILDVHPRSMKDIKNPEVPLWIVEGAKKADSLVSRGECAVSISGVWNFAVSKTKSEKLLPCWDHIALESREVIIAYDSDAQTNKDIQDALSKLVLRLKERGANVLSVYLSEINKNTKAGVDDYFAAGGTLEDLYSLATDFEPIEITEEDELWIRLDKYPDLEKNIGAMCYVLQNTNWKGRRGKTARSVLKNLIRYAIKKGHVVKSGIRVRISQRFLAELCGIHQMTVFNALKYLIENNLIKRHSRGKNKGEPDSYILLSKTTKSVPKLGLRIENIMWDIDTSLPSLSIIDLISEHLNLRNTIPSTKSKKGLVKGSRKVRQSISTKERGGIKRLGKGVEEILNVLALKQTRSFTEFIRIEDLASDLDLKNPRKLKMRLKDLETLGITEIEDDGVKLAPDWMDRVRELQGMALEDESAKAQIKRHQSQRETYYNWTPEGDTSQMLCEHSGCHQIRIKDGLCKRHYRELHPEDKTAVDTDVPSDAESHNEHNPIPDNQLCEFYMCNRKALEESGSFWVCEEHSERYAPLS